MFEQKAVFPFFLLKRKLTRTLVFSSGCQRKLVENILFLRTRDSNSQAFADPYQGLARNKLCFFLVVRVSPECKIHYLMKKQQYLSPAVLLLKRESLAGCATFSFLFFLLQTFFTLFTFKWAFSLIFPVSWTIEPVMT